MALIPGMGMAADDGPVERPDSVGQPIDQVTGGVDEALGSSAQVPPDPTTDDDSEGHVSPDPEGSDHASGGIADTEVDGNEVATVGHTESTIEDDDSSSTDVTVLAIGGEEIVGAHSESDGAENDSQDPLAPLCEESGGAVCLGLLFADASSSEGSNSSSATGSAALAFACLGGTQTDAGATCDGPVSAGVSESNSDIKRNKTTGETEASHGNDVADVCLGGANATGACSGAGVEAGHSESTSNSGSPNGQGSTERDSFLLGVEANGERNEIVGDPTAIAVPPGCPEDESVVCVFFNQGESFVFSGGAAGHQETVHVSVGPDLLLGHVATSETLATNDGPSDVVQGGGPDAPGDADDPNDTVLGAAPGDDSVLPLTGTTVWLLLSLAFALIAAGAWVLALQRGPKGRAGR
ncbi:MAG: hypothetical protein ACRDJ2_12785 [Actinomycetota bacterium]